MKKIIFLFLISFTLVSCNSIEIWNNYYPFLITQEEKKIEKIISLYGDVENLSDENSYLERVRLLEKIKTPKKGVKLLEPEIVVETNQKYRLKNISKSNYIEVYNQGVKVNDDIFTVYIGKVQLDNGEIIDLPPIKFKRYVYVYKINKLMDALNQDTKESLFEGTIEEYREWKKKNN